jgi:mRNA interferase MazF
VNRGEIFRIRFQGRGREQRGPRFAVVVQPRSCSAVHRARRAYVAQRRCCDVQPTVEVDGEQTRILVERLRAVDLQRLGEPAGRLSAPELRAVDEALELVLGP